MVTFRFIDFGVDLGTRQMGQAAHAKLLPLVQGEEKSSFRIFGSRCSY